MNDLLSTADGRLRSRRGLAVLSLMTLVQIVGTASILALTALAPAVAPALGVGAHWIGYQISLIYFVGLFASAFAGSIVAFLRPERVIPLELGLFGLGLGLLGLGRTDAILLASVLFGIAYGLNNPASSEILARETPAARRSLVFSVKQSGVPLGAIVANAGLPALALWLGGAWTTAMVVAALGPLALMLASLAAFERPARGPRPNARRFVADFRAEQGAILHDPARRALAALGGLYSAMQLTVTAFAVVSLTDQGWTVTQAGLVGAAIQLAGAFGRIGWGIAADRLGGFGALALIGLLSGGLSLLLGFGPRLGDAGQVAAMVALGSVAVGWNGVFLAATARNAPDGRVGAEMGAVLVYTFLGVILGPSLFALAYQATESYHACFALFAIPGLIGAVIARRCQRYD